jgi:hypothetical protein
MLSMDILNLAERVAKESDLGLPFSVFRGNKYKPLDSQRPHVFITLADIRRNVLPADSTSYSWIDFAYDPDSKLIHSPWISLISEHRDGLIARKLNHIMEEIGVRSGAIGIRAYNIINPKLRKLMPRLGYINSGQDQRGQYFEKNFSSFHNI